MKGLACRIDALLSPQRAKSGPTILLATVLWSGADGWGFSHRIYKLGALRVHERHVLLVQEPSSSIVAP